MSYRIDDRYAWLTFGLFFLGAAYGIRYAITDIVNLTKVHPSESSHYEEGTKIDEDPEKSISLATLKTLASSPNPNIANSAISIIVQRFSALPHPAEILVHDAYGKDPVLRQKARNAIAFLHDWPISSGLDDDVRDMNLPSFPSREMNAREMLGGEDWGDDEIEAEQLTPESLPDLADVTGGGEDSSPVTYWNSIPRERPPATRDADEAERRRRRREAMVLHDGAGRIGESDIFRPR